MFDAQNTFMPTTITDIEKLIAILVYSTTGHYTLLAGSLKEARNVAMILFNCPDVYKVQVRAQQSDRNLFELV